MTMTEEIRQVRRELLAWSDGNAEPIRARAQIIAVNLRRLITEPDNLPLRIQTMKNVEDLARACR